MADVVEMDIRTFLNRLEQLFIKLTEVAAMRDPNFKRGGTIAKALAGFTEEIHNVYDAALFDQPKALPSIQEAQSVASVEQKGNPVYFVRIRVGGTPTFAIRQMSPAEAAFPLKQR